MSQPFLVQMPRSEQTMPGTLHTLADLSGKPMGLRDVDLDEFSGTLAMLPPVEEDILRLSALGVNQYAIALLLESTQASVSYRLGRARQRLKWLAERPSRPEDFDEEMNRLVGEEWGPVVTMAIDTTAEAVAADHHGVENAALRRVVDRMKTMVVGPHKAYVEHTTSHWQILVEPRQHGHVGTLSEGRGPERVEQDYDDVCRRYKEMIKRSITR